MPTIVLRTATSDTHCEDLYGCECAVIELRRPLVKTLRERGELAKSAWRKCHAVAEVTFCPDYHAAFYSSELITACEAHDPQFAETWDCNGIALVPDCVGLAAFELQATEAHDMRVLVDRPHGQKLSCELAWSARPRHCDLTVSTVSVPLTWLVSLLAPTRRQAQRRLVRQSRL